MACFRLIELTEVTRPISVKQKESLILLYCGLMHFLINMHLQNQDGTTGQPTSEYLCSSLSGFIAPSVTSCTQLTHLVKIKILQVLGFLVNYGMIFGRMLLL